MPSTSKSRSRANTKSAQAGPTHIEIVYWLDAVASSGWIDAAEPFEAAPCISVGFVSETKASITIAGTYGGNERNNRMTIPKGMVIKRQKVKLVV